MNNDFLTRLYWVCSDEGSHYAQGLNLNEGYERIEAVEKAVSAFEAVNPSERFSEQVNEIQIACELQGFINGFRMGFQMAEEIHK